MTAPALRSIDSLPPAVRRELPPLPRDGVEVFVVTSEGRHGNAQFAAGDLLVCRGPAPHGGTTVLVARGHGRPRLGTVEGPRFRGDAGEPCHPSRWRAAGALVARYRRDEHGWVVELRDMGPQGEQNTAVVGTTANGISSWTTGDRPAAKPERQARPIDSGVGRAAAEGLGGPSAAQLPLFVG